MPKFRFLCANHRQWLTDNPAAIPHTWAQSYGHSQGLIDAGDFEQAVSHAGAAFESADIGLQQTSLADAPAIARFSKAGVMLVQLLQHLGETRLARNIIAAAVARLEQLLMQGIERSTVLRGCEELLRIGDSLPMARGHAQDPGFTADPAAATLH